MQETQTRSLGWEKSSGEGNGNPLQYSGLENPHGQRTLVGYSSRDHKESDMTEWLKLLLLQTGALQVALVIKNLPADAEDVRNVSSTPGWEDAWSKIWQSVPVFLPGKSHGQRSLAGYSSWGCKESSFSCSRALSRTHFLFFCFTFKFIIIIIIGFAVWHVRF